MNSKIDSMSLRMKVKINVPLELTVDSGEQLSQTEAAEILQPILQELEVIRRMEVPQDVIAFRNCFFRDAEIREVQVSVSQQLLPGQDRNYIVSYHTIRGKEIKNKTYTGKQLRALSVS